MPKQKQVPGLALRLTAADRLQQVLKGASFVPLSAAEVVDGRDRALAMDQWDLTAAAAAGKKAPKYPRPKVARTRKPREV